MNHRSEKWDQLSKEWTESLQKAKIRQSIIDDKMHSPPRGNGCLPTAEELKIVEQLWGQHVEARNKTNQFIQAVLQNYTTTDAAP
jgi:hypothetical protein